LYGYGGVGIIAEIMTDNKNRASSDMRIATNKRGGTVANPGSVAFNFDRKGVIQISRKHGIEDEVFKAALDSGAEDFEADEEMYIITTDPGHLFTVKDAINQLGFECDEASLEMIPKVYVDCDEEAMKNNLALIDWLENIEDVDTVYHNMKME
jgi:YebC/PmpR family DNA-binding regulatory protein